MQINQLGKAFLKLYQLLPSVKTEETIMVNAIERRLMRSKTSLLMRPINETAVLIHEDVEPLPSMFRRGHTTGAEATRGSSDMKARFSPYIIAFVLLTVAPAQAALLMSSVPINKEEAIEEVLGLAKQGAADIAALLTMSSAAKPDAYSAGDLD